MLTRRRIIVAAALLLLAAVLWSAWLSYQVVQDLRRVESSATSLEAALRAGDDQSRDAAITEFQEAAASAHDRTDGLWWGALTVIPFVGDDVSGVRTVSASLDLVARDAITPLGDLLDGVDDLVVDGRIDVKRISELQEPVAGADTALATALDSVTAEDSDGYVGALGSRYDEYEDRLGDLSASMSAAVTTVDVLPGMLGGESPRDYLLIFENNAEIRATGGLPGSWARLRADDGQLELREQGTAGDFPAYPEPITPLSEGESAAFGPELGRFFQDPNFTPDFPRAAEVFNAFWEAEYPEIPLDGVLAIDVVGLSYLLRGLGPVTVQETTLTSDNAVQVLLSDVYQEPDPALQDAFFQESARAIFDAIAAGPASPVDFVEGFGTAASEGRLLVAPFVPEEADELSGTRVAGELAGDTGSTPHVDLALNDATASKMSYYLRYESSVESVSCEAGVQTLLGRTVFTQTISQEDARSLPSYVTGTNPIVEAGAQIVRMHVIGPYGGSIGEVRFDGQVVATSEESVSLDGRPVSTIAAVLDSTEPVEVTYAMTTGSGQTGSIHLNETPSVVPGDRRQVLPSGC